MSGYHSLQAGQLRITLPRTRGKLLAYGGQASIEIGKEKGLLRIGEPFFR